MTCEQHLNAPRIEVRWGSPKGPVSLGVQHRDAVSLNDSHFDDGNSVVDAVIAGHWGPARFGEAYRLAIGAPPAPEPAARTLTATRQITLDAYAPSDRAASAPATSSASARACLRCSTANGCSSSVSASHSLRGVPKKSPP